MHLFAGVGGGLLADLILGHTPLVAVEWEPYACQVLRERAAEGWFPDLHVWEGDVRLFDPSEYTGRVDCIHAGFPCQDISVAGKQAGVAEGTRSGLYREVLRVAGIIRPQYLYLENVAAITSKGLDQVLKDLAEMGYDCRWCCIRASDVGAPHHRDRWWLLADSRRGSFEPEHANRSERSAASSREGEAWEWERGRIDYRCCGQDVADPMCEGLEGQRKVPSGIGEEQCDAGNPCWWESEPIVGRVANGVPNRVQRLKGLGNAQVPLQAAVAWKLLGGP